MRVVGCLAALLEGIIAARAAQSPGKQSAGRRRCALSPCAAGLDGHRLPLVIRTRKLVTKGGMSKQISSPAVIGRFDGAGRPSAELWIRLEAFLSMRSPRTHETYRGILREWSSYLKAELGSAESASRLTQATDLHAMAYVNWLSSRPGEIPRLKRKVSSAARSIVLSQGAGREKKLGVEHFQSNATIAKKIAALRRIYRMLIGAGLVSGGNPFDSDKLRAPPKDSGRKRPTEMVPFEKVLQIIEQADISTPKGRQDRAILACLFGAGLRRSEVVNLRIADLRKSSAGTVFLYLRATKAGRDAQQALPEWAAAALAAHLKERIKNKAEGADPLFVSFRGKGGASPAPSSISPAGVYKLFKTCCRRAGVGSFFTPHSARATAITKLLEDGIPHREVQEFSRHSSIQMVELYDKRRIGVDRNPARKLRY